MPFLAALWGCSNLYFLQGSITDETQPHEPLKEQETLHPDCRQRPSEEQPPNQQNPWRDNSLTWPAGNLSTLGSPPEGAFNSIREGPSLTLSK